MTKSNYKYSNFKFIKVGLDIDDCVEFQNVLNIANFGVTYAWIWERLARHAANTQGELYKLEGDFKNALQPFDVVNICSTKNIDEDVVEEAIKKLIENGLLYINSYGYLCITGLYFSGDPKEPILHLRKNGAPITPITVGIDLTETQRKNIKYRTRQKLIDERKLELDVPPNSGITYSAIVNVTHLNKSTISRAITKLNFNDRLIAIGSQKKLIPNELLKPLLSELATNHEIDVDIILNELLDTSDSTNLTPSEEKSISCNGSRNGSRNGSHFDCNGSCNGSQNEIEDVVIPHNYAVFDDCNGSCNGSHFDCNGSRNGLATVFPLKEEEKNRRTFDDDREARPKNPPSEQVRLVNKDLSILLRIGFGFGMDTSSNKTKLRELVSTYGYDVVLAALKKSKPFEKDGVPYIEPICKQIIDGGGLKPHQIVPKRTDDSFENEMKQILFNAFENRNYSSVIAAFDEIFFDYGKYFTDHEISLALLSFFDKDYDTNSFYDDFMNMLFSGDCYEKY